VQQRLGALLVIMGSYGGKNLHIPGGLGAVDRRDLWGLNMMLELSRIIAEAEALPCRKRQIGGALEIDCLEQEPKG